MTIHSIRSQVLEAAGWKETQGSLQGGVGEATWVDPLGKTPPLQTDEAFQVQCERDAGKSASP